MVSYDRNDLPSQYERMRISECLRPRDGCVGLYNVGFDASIPAHEKV